MSSNNLRYQFNYLHERLIIIKRHRSSLNIQSINQTLNLTCFENHSIRIKHNIIEKYKVKQHLKLTSLVTRGSQIHILIQIQKHKDKRKVKEPKKTLHEASHLMDFANLLSVVTSGYQMASKVILSLSNFLGQELTLLGLNYVLNSVP